MTGKNTHFLQEELQRIISDHRNSNGDSVERFDGSEIQSADLLLDAVRSVSFLDPKKLVVVRDFAQSSDLLERIETVVNQSAKSTDLVLVDQKLDKRTSVYKYLKTNTDLRVFSEPSPYDIENWVVDCAKRLDAEIKKAEVRYLIERVGNNQLLLNQEITKLAIHSSIITKADIVQLTEQTPQSKVFDMLDALFAGNGKKAWAIYQDQRKQGEEPQKILAMITWQLQQLTMAVFAPDKNKDALTSAGMSPYSAQKSLSTARNINKSDLKHYITELAELDTLSKINADIESALSVYFTDVATRQGG